MIIRGIYKILPKDSILYHKVSPLICTYVMLENSLADIQDKNKTNLMVSCAWCGEILNQNSIILHC